ncbi:MAG: xylulokinase [Thermomicrobiales bacterium]
MEEALLGLDLGTSAVKALICDERGRVLGRGHAEHPINRPVPGAAEQDPEDWWQAVKVATWQALAGRGSSKIAAIGLTGQMHGTILLDRHDRPVLPAIIWADARSRAEVEAITATIGSPRLIQITGSPLATGFQAATVKWVQRNYAQKWPSVRRILLPKDYLRLRLTGDFATDPSDASSTLLLDLNTRQWSEQMLDTVRIERSMLPAILPSAAITGTLTGEAANELGLSSGVPVIAGGGDAPCGALGAGIVDPNSMLLTISTGGQALVPSDSPKIDTSGRMHTYCSALNRPGWYQMGATLVAGLAMKWLRDEVFALDDESGYDEMTRLAAMAPPGASGLIFLPYLIGERTPHMNPTARGMFIGLTASHGRAHLTRAVMEGVTFALFDAYDVLRQAGASPASVVLAGGGAKSGLWQELVADVFDMTIVPLKTAEQSARGAALLAGEGVGWFNAASTAASWVEYGPAVTADSSDHEIYSQLLPMYRDAYAKHIDDFERLAQIEQNALKRPTAFAE